MASPNILLDISMITNEALVVLANNTSFTKLINRQYDSYFSKKGAQIGATINIRKPVRYVGRRSQTLSVEGSQESSVPLALNIPYGVDMNFTSNDYVLNINDFSKQFLVPAMSQLASMIDQDGLALAKQIYNAVGTPGTAPNSTQTYLQAGARLNNEAVPPNDRYIVYNANTEIAIVGALQGLFNPTNKISTQYETGSMRGRALGFEWYLDQTVYVHTVGTYSGTPLVNGSTAQGATSIVTDGWGAASFLNVGDLFTIAGVYAVNPQTRANYGDLRQFVVNSLATADGSGNMTINFSPALVAPDGGNPVNNQNVTALPADNAAITVFGASGTITPQNLAFQKDAFAFATVDLPDMPGVECSVQSLPELGFSLRIMRGTDMVNNRQICRCDLLGGWAVLRPEMAVRIAA